MEKPIRVLHILATMDIGGIENFLMNIYRNIDRKKIQFDFVVNNREKEENFEKEIISLGGKIYKVPSISNGRHFEYLKNLKKIFYENNYNIVHSHYNAISGFILNEAKKSGIKNRIAHSHVAFPKYGFFSKIYKGYSKYLLNKVATVRIACSKAAGEWLYQDNNFQVIKNGIEIENFLFSMENRKSIRKKLEIEEDEFTIVSIGRMTEEKNHKFMIEIMKELEYRKTNIKLYFLGDGELRKELERKVAEYKLKNIIFLGIRKDVKEILNGMDLMLFPSLYEGLGIVAIEAQTNGLKVLASENIPKEADMKLGKFISLSLNYGSKLWVEEIVKIKENFTREQGDEERKKLISSDYNINQIVRQLEEIYISLNRGD